jgi:hypothetical protein
MDPVYSYATETTILALVEKGTMLPLPESCISPKARVSMNFCGADSWRMMKPTRKALMQALNYAMAFSPALLSSSLDPQEYMDAVMMPSKMRSVSHGV